MSDLEAQIEKLTQENEELRARTQTSHVDDENTSLISFDLPPSSEPRDTQLHRQVSSDVTSDHFQNLVSSVRNVVVEPSRQSQFLGQSSGISFARLVMAAIHIDRQPLSVAPEQQMHGPLLSTPIKPSLPPRHVADHLVDVYFQYRTPHLPILDRSHAEKALERVYLTSVDDKPSDVIEDQDIFTTYMVFAIALCDVQNVSGGRPSQSEGCFSSALEWVEKVLTYSKSDLETLRAVLLLAQFVALFPSRGSLWHLTGFALRLCVDIGLHWENEEISLNISADLLNDRRRLWYCAYQFDRVLCITLGRPVGILDESTRVQLPNPWVRSHSTPNNELDAFDIHSQRAHNHLFTMSRLESEVRHVQHSQVWDSKLAYPRTNYLTWIQDIQPRLHEWYSTIPEPSKAHASSIFASHAYWDVIYNNAIFLLYRPNSPAPNQSIDHILNFFEASCKLVSCIKVLQRDGKLEMLWKSVHHMFMAGLGVIYGLWHSKEVRDRSPIGGSISTLQSCASTLSAMSETLPGAVGCRDAFDALSSATIDWLVTKDIEESRQNRVEFEKQVMDLMHQLQLPGSTSMNQSGTNNMSALLSTDSFALSDLLQSAAQWPISRDEGYGDMRNDNMTVTEL